MHRELAPLDLYVILYEMQNLIGSYVDKIFQPTRDEVVIKVKKDSSQKDTIYIRNGALFCKTEKDFIAPIKPTQFSMTLRKYLLNGKIKEITQHEFDRIIKIKIQKKEGVFSLVVELFRNGNILLLDPDGIILQPLIVQHWSQRTLKTHEQYAPPPSQKNPFTMTYQDFLETLQQSNKDIVRTLAVSMNLGGVYAEELCLQANIDKNTKIKDLSEENKKTLYNTLEKILDVFRKKDFHPVVFQESGNITHIHPFPLLNYKDMKYTTVPSFSLNLQEYITEDSTQTRQDSAYQHKVERLQRQLHQQQDSIETFKEQIAKSRQEGDILYLFSNQLQKLLDEITVFLKQKDKEKTLELLRKNPYISNFNPEENLLVVRLADNTGVSFDVKIDFRKSVSENAEIKYQEGKKHKEKIEGAKKAIEETETLIKKIQEKKAVEETQKIHKQKNEKRFWFESYRWCISSEGNVIIGGFDAKSNEQIVKKYLRDGDRYVHADIHGAPSCVVKNQDIHGNTLPISEKTLTEACDFGAVYSKAWKQFAETQAYWVLPEQVSKTPQTGEFLPKGAFMIRGKRTYCRCPMEIAIGVVVLDDVQKIIGGPEEAIKTHSHIYALLKPGTQKTSSIAKVLSKAFEVSVDMVQKVLPPGEAHIMKQVGFKIT